MISMSDMKPGSQPTAFKFAHTGQGGSGRWTVVTDSSASDGRAIEQTSTDRTDHRFPLAIYQQDLPRDIDVQLRFKAICISAQCE